MRIQFTVTDEELEILTKKAIEGDFPSITEYCRCSSLQENTGYTDLYTTLLNKINSLPKGREFVLKELIVTPSALIDRWFYENVDKRLVKNMEHVGKAGGGVEEYKRIQIMLEMYFMVEENKETVIVDDKTIQEKIYLIRGQKAMLDADLAEIYGYETKNFNRQVKNSIEKFEDEDFMFRLTENEFENLRCKNFISSWGGSKYLPNASTEQGIYMLMAVLRGELAIRQSRTLIKTFKRMKNFIIESQDFTSSKELVQIVVQTSQNTKDIAETKSQMATKEDLKKVMDNFIDPETYKHSFLMNGDKIEADVAYTKVHKSAKKSIHVTGSYVGFKILELLRAARDKTQVMVFSDNVKNKNMLTKNILDDFRKNYSNIDLELKIAGEKHHDRYIAIDYGIGNEAFYFCGASPKDAGNKMSSITKIEESSKDMYHTMFGGMLNNKDLKI